MLGSVLLIDDGELGSALDELQQLDVVIDHVPGDPKAEDLEPPYELVVSSVRRAPALAHALEVAGAGTKPPWIAIHHQDFLPLRDRLRRAGVDYLVVDGVTSDALRLLFLHALYRGPEKRRAPRLPVGAEVSWTSGEKGGTACLLDLTVQGCRVSGPEGIEAGDRLALRFQSGITAGRELRLEGRVTRADFGPAPELPRLAIGFEGLDARTRQALEAILRGNAIGTRVTPLASEAASSAPAALRTDTPAPVFEDVPDEPEDDEVLLEQEDRRVRPRARYQREVTAESRGASLVLIGHDLSPDGMRIDADPNLRVGSLLRITIYGGPGQRPAVIPARVVHDEGERGMLIGFNQMPKEAREALESILAAAPTIEVLTESDEDSGPVVVTESIFD